MNMNRVGNKLFRWLFFLFICLMGTHFAQAQNYTVTNLRGDQFMGMNASGQVIVSENTPEGGLESYFFDGTQSLNIGTLGGIRTQAVAFSDLGQVVGFSTLLGSVRNRAFSWTQTGGMIDLGTLGGTQSVAHDVNASGQVVGWAYTSGDGAQHAFLWTPGGGMVDLGTLGGTYSYAVGINASGQVVGYSDVAGPAFAKQHAFLWTPVGGMVDLGTLGGTHSRALDVNAAGQVTGWSDTANNERHAFSWTQAGGMVDLGTFGGTLSEPTGINASGQVVGWAYTTGNVAQHAFLWTPGAAGAPGVLLDLGTIAGISSVASGINASRQVVGWSTYRTGYSQHAFLWTQSGGMVDLNTRIPSAPAGMELRAALAVSDNGSIAAYTNAGDLVLLGGSSTAPVVGPIAAGDPAAAGVQLTLSASFTDVDTTDTHTAQWTWGDASASEYGIVSETGGSGTVSGTHVFPAAGIYTVSLVVSDSGGRTAQVSRDIVVYDPSAGFVTGRGWIDSPLGAYKADLTLAGRATFRFVSKYHKGASTPTGRSKFHFRIAMLDFRSEAYDWLVISGTRAQYKGTGTINGAGGYKFLLTAIDGKGKGKGNGKGNGNGNGNDNGNADRFRIKISHFDAALQADVVDYDNQIDDSLAGTPTEGTVIGGGRIVIHK